MSVDHPSCGAAPLPSMGYVTAHIGGRGGGVDATGAIADRIIEAGDRALAADQPAEPAFLGERIDAIASDIEDVIGDACDAHLPHRLVKALTLATAAIRHAQREMQRAASAQQSFNEVSP